MNVDDDEVIGGWSIAPSAGRALRLSVARQALRQRDPARATVELEELLDEAPGDVTALYALAEASADLRDVPVAREAWRALVSLGEDRAVLWTQIAQASFAMADLDAAEIEARAAVSRDADQAAGWFLIGQIAERRLDRAHAWEDYERAHQIDPLSFPFPLTLDDELLHALVAESFRATTPDIRRFWRGVPRHYLRFPDVETLRAATPPLSPRVVALYEGLAPAERDPDSRPTALHLFRGNLEHQASYEDAVDELAWALEDEAATWRRDS